MHRPADTTERSKMKLNLPWLAMMIPCFKAFFSEPPLGIHVRDASRYRPPGHHHQYDHDPVRYRGRANSQQAVKTEEEAKPRQVAARKLNPLETLVKVYAETTAAKDARPDRRYPFLTGLPLRPYFERETLRTEEIPGTLWTFEQPQEFFNVSVNIRMTAIRLEEGGLWIHAPVAPTEECVRLLTELGEEVRYIVLPTTAGFLGKAARLDDAETLLPGYQTDSFIQFEHKVYVKPFSDRFPKAEVYVCPGQWSWPVNFPPAFRIDGTLCGGEPAPWEDEIECKLFAPPPTGVGPTNEVLFFHKASKTLLVTDLVIWIPRNPPPIVGVEGLLEAAAEEGAAPLPDSAENRRKGWEKMSLQVLFLGPALPTTFAIVSEKLVVSPVFRTLNLGKVLPYVREFVSDVCDSWPDLRGFLACHYSGLTRASSRDFKAAFGFAFASGTSKEGKDNDMAQVPVAGKGVDLKGTGSAQGILEALGLQWLVDQIAGRTTSPAGDDAIVDNLADVPEEDFAALNSLNELVVSYGIADPATGAP